MIRSARIGQRPVHKSVPVLGHRADGTPIYGIAGGAADDDDDGDEDDEEDDEDEEEDDSSGSGDGSSNDDDDDDDDDDVPVTKDELNKARRTARKASREAAKYRRKLRELEAAKGKGKSSEEDDAEAKELRTKAQRAEELEADNVALSVQLAVLSTKEAQRFHDPDDLFKNLDTADVVGDDGSVDREALADALEELAERKPHLVKTESGSTKGKGDDEDEEEDKKPPRSGRQTNGKKDKNKGLTREALAKKYPALRR